MRIFEKIVLQVFKTKEAPFFQKKISIFQLNVSPDKRKKYFLNCIFTLACSRLIIMEHINFYIFFEKEVKFFWSITISTVFSRACLWCEIKINIYGSSTGLSAIDCITLSACKHDTFWK